MRGALIASAGTRGHLLLQTLAESYPKALDTAELTDDQTYASGAKRIHALNHNGAILRRLEARGLVQDAGRTRASFQGPSTRLWAVTTAGLSHLEWVNDAPARKKADASRERAERKAKRLCQETLAKYQNIYAGPEWRNFHLWDAVQVAKQRERERAEAMRHLRNLGCTLKDIGAVFGVTSERVRQITSAN